MAAYNITTNTNFDALTGASVNSTLDGNCKMCIHTITHRDTGRMYVGQTVQVANKRWGQHCSNKSGGGRSAIKAAIQKYGRAAFDFQVVSQENSQTNLDAQEVNLIRSLDTVSPKGFNLGLGGNGKGKVSEATRKLISDVQKGKKRSPASIEKGRLKAIGRVGPWSGKKQSAELVERRSSKLRGRKRTSEQVAALVLSNKGRVTSIETREKISLSLSGRIGATLGRKLSALHIEKIRALKTGVIPSQATREKMSAAQKGRTHTEATKEKLSQYKIGVPRSNEDVVAMSRAKMKGRVVCCSSGERMQSYFEAALTTGIDRRIIWNCANGVQKTTAGLRFWLEAA